MQRVDLQTVATQLLVQLTPRFSADKVEWSAKKKLQVLEDERAALKKIKMMENNLPAM